MNLTHPTIKKKIAALQDELQNMTKCDVRVMAIIEPVNKRLSFQEVSKVVCRVTGVSFSKVLKGTRHTQISLTRHLICYFSYKNTSLCLQDIAYKLGKDHTSVMHANRRIDGLIESGDAGVIWFIHQINESLNEIGT